MTAPIIRPPYGDGAFQGTRGRTKVVILAEAQNWRCAYCPTIMSMPKARCSAQPPDAATIDHYLAQAAGGRKTWENEVAACEACNSAKGQTSAALFWLMMRYHHFSRGAVVRAINRMTKKQRGRARKHLGNAYGWPVTPDPTSTPAPSP